MKNKIFVFIIGVLVGAIITTLVFWLCVKSDNKDLNENSKQMMQERGDGKMPKGTPPDKTSGDKSSQDSNSKEKPDMNNSEANSTKKPDDEKNTNNA